MLILQKLMLWPYTSWYALCCVLQSEAKLSQMFVLIHQVSFGLLWGKCYKPHVVSDFYGREFFFWHFILYAFFFLGLCIHSLTVSRMESSVLSVVKGCCGCSEGWVLLRCRIYWLLLECCYSPDSAQLDVNNSLLGKGKKKITFLRSRCLSVWFLFIFIAYPTTTIFQT